MKNKEFKSYYDTLEAIKGDKLGMIDLKDININFLTRELCSEAVKHNIHRLKDIPIELKSEEFYLLVVGQNGSKIEFFTENEITDRIVKEAFKTYPAAILFMDNNEITEEIALDAIKRLSKKDDIFSDVEEYSYLLYYVFKKIPDSIFTTEMRDMAIKLGLR